MTLAVTGLASAPAFAGPAAAASADSVIARAERAMGAAGLNALQFSASGTGSTFGQAYTPGGPWPKLELTEFSRLYDYRNGGVREDSARRRAEPKGGGAVPLMGTGEQRASGFAQGEFAWNLVGQNAAAAPVARASRLHDLWTSPHGVLMAARRQRATVSFRTVAGRSMAAVSFAESGLMKATALISEDGLVERVEATIPHPVTGDTTFVTEYADYRDHEGVKFPSRMRLLHGREPVLDLKVAQVKVNPTATVTAPENVRGFAERVVSEKVADGVWFLAGGSHNSVAIEMKDHVIVVETPLYDGRSAAVLAEARKLVPGKPVRTVINSHHHFDHAGGLRTAAAEGATLLVAAPAKSYFERVFSQPNSIAPDALAKSRKRAKLVGYRGKHVIQDGSRSVEVHAIADSIHAEGFTLVYLPRERLLIEADAYTPSPAGAPPPARPNANHENLVANIERLKLSVERILPLHGRVVPYSELLTMIGRKS